MRLILCCLLAALCTLACAGLSLPLGEPAATLIVIAADPAAATPETLEAARAVLQERYAESLNGRANVVVDGSALRVELFDGSDTALASQLATETGAIEFFDSVDSIAVGAPVPAGAAPVLTEADIAAAQAMMNEQTGQAYIQFTLTEEGRGKLASYTQANVGRFLVIARDRIVLSSPFVQSPITGGEGVFEGGFDTESATALAAQLNSGRLPLALVVSEIK
jgi:preprotein translocase subunit SecD